jgi:CO/xanthine dehydrogenase Mo-binding subunit
MGMGIGTSLYEQLVYDKGKLLNRDLTNYKIPTFAEMPNVRDIGSLIVAVPHREGPFGAKGFSEEALGFVAAAIANAVHDAIGKPIYEGPLTRERVLRTIKEDLKI